MFEYPHCGSVSKHFVNWFHEIFLCNEGKLLVFHTVQCKNYGNLFHGNNNINCRVWIATEEVDYTKFLTWFESKTTIKIKLTKKS